MQRYFSRRIYCCFLAPALILFTAFLIAPAFVMVPISFQDNNSISNLGWVGWENYIKVFKDSKFWISQLNVMKMLLVSLLSMPLGWLLAFALNKTHGWVAGLFRFAALFPAVLSITAIAKMFQGVFNANFGLINSVLEAIGLDALTHSWLSSKDTAIWCIALCNVWMGIGIGVIIKESAIKAIPQSYVEAAMLDGCTPSQADWKIRFPLLRNILQYDLITSVIGTLCAFALIEVISVTSPPSKYVMSPILYIVGTSMGSLKFGLGCAMALIFFIECVVASIIVNKVTEHESIEY